MIKRIQQFEEVGVKKLGKVLKDFVKEPQKQAESIYGVTVSKQTVKNIRSMT